MTAVIFNEAAKRFQQRSATSESVNSIRTSWARSDVDFLAPLLTQNPEQEKDESIVRNVRECETVFVVWKTFVGIFSLFDAAESDRTSSPGAVAHRFLQLHSDSYYNFEYLAAGASEFARCATRGVPSEREFQVAYQAATTFALSGRLTEASLVLESMIQGVNHVVEDRNLRNNSNTNNDEDDAPGGPFSPEEQNVFMGIAHLLRLPYNQSQNSLTQWRSAASKLLADIRSVAVVQPGKIRELDILRRFALQVLFVISGDVKVLKETVNSCDFLEGKALWFAAGSCSLMSPFASKKQIVEFFKEYGTISQSSTSFSPVRVTGGGNNSNNDGNNNEAPTQWDRLFIDAISVEYSSSLVKVVQQAVNFATDRAPGNVNVATLSAMMGAHLADLCCDLSDPDNLIQRNELVESYVKTLFVNFPGLWEIALAYVTSSPLMDPAVTVLCLRQGQEVDLELASRLFDEVVHPRCVHQQQLRARWVRQNTHIDWKSIFETCDIVLEEERRKLAIDRAETLWNNDGRYVDAVNLLVSTGNYAAAEHLLRRALENFSLGSSSGQRVSDDGEVGADSQQQNEDSTVSSISTIYNPVLAIGDAATMGQVSDPTLEGTLQRRAAHNLIVASSAGGANTSSPTPVALCRRIAELFSARSAINVLEFILPIIGDQNFVVSTPVAVKKFVLSLALSNVSKATMEQILVVNCVLQQCEKELGGEENLNEYSKRILDLLIQ